MTTGLIAEPPDYVIGRAMIDDGRGVAGGKPLHLAVPFDQLPACYEAAAEVNQIVEGEGRHDLIVEKDSWIHMSDAGLLRLSDVDIEAGVPLTEWSLRQLAGKITTTKARADAYFVHVWPELRAHNFNEQVEKYWRKSSRRPIRLRLKQLPELHVFAAVSKIYAAFDINHLTELVANEVPEECRAEVIYSNGRHLKLSIVFDDVIKVGTAPYNYEFHPMLVIETSDDGTSNISMTGGMRTDATQSAMIFEGRHLTTFERRHIESQSSDRPRIAAEFRTKLGQSFDAMEGVRQLFKAHWDEAVHLEVLDASPESPHDLFEYLVDRGHINAGGARIRRKDLVTKLEEAYLRRADHTKAAVIDSILHVAREGGWGALVEDTLQRCAGRLLMSNIIINRR